MFYKNTEHYENTFKKVVRERFGVELKFVSDKVLDIMHMLWITADRDGEYTSGYDFLSWIRSSCNDYKEFSKAFRKLIEEINYSHMDVEQLFDFHAKVILDELGILPEREEF